MEFISYVTWSLIIGIINLQRNGSRHYFHGSFLKLTVSISAPVMQILMSVSFENQILQDMKNYILVTAVVHAMTHRVTTCANANLVSKVMVKVTKDVSSYSQNMQLR